MANTSILIVGAGGLIGQYLLAHFQDQDKLRVVPATRSGKDGLSPNEVRLDITNKEEVEATIDQLNPDLIINASGINGYAICEQNKERAYEVNVKGVEHIVQAIDEDQCIFIQLSTNAVFGQGEGNYLEETPLDPTSVYGKTKRQAELITLETLKRSMVIRTCDVYGTYPFIEKQPRFLHQVIKHIKEEIPFDVFANVKSTPTYADDIGKGIDFLIRHAFSGTIHLAGPEVLNRYEYACEIAHAFDLPLDFLKISSASNYPSNGSLNTALIKSMGFHPLTPSAGLAALAGHHSS